MKRIIKIIKAFWFMYPSDFDWLLPLSIFITGLLSIMLCSTITDMVLNYVNGDQTIQFNRLVIQMITLSNLSYVFILNTQRSSGLKSKVTGNMNNFLIQAPILKKDIYNVKFGIFQVLSIPYFIVVIYFIGLNVFVSTSQLISAYSGFFVLIYCICTMALTISTGFSSLSSKKYKVFRFVFTVLFLLIILVFAFYLLSIPELQPGTLITTQNIFSGLGPMFIPILKACRYIGGVSGLIVILLSTLISYFIGCKLPLKISEKVGN